MISKDNAPSILAIVCLAFFLCLCGLLLNGIIMHIAVKKKLCKTVDEVLRIFLIGSTFPQSIFLGLIAVYYTLLIDPHYAKVIDNCTILMSCIGTYYSLWSMTIVIMLTMIVELYLATVRPFFFESQYNKRFYLYVMSSAIIILIGFICACSIFPAKMWNFFRVYIFLFPAVVAFSIVYLTRQINKELLEMQRRAFTIEDTASKIRCQKRTKKLGLTIIITYAVCQSPISVLMPVLKFVDFSNVMAEVTVLYLSFHLISYLHIIAFPTIFCYRIRSIRNELKKRFFFLKRNNVDSSDIRNVECDTSTTK